MKKPLKSSNAAPDEIEKFNQIGQRWWTQSTDGHEQNASSPLHDINPYRLSFIQQYSELKNTFILDIGCGGGILSESLAQAGANVTGIDLSESALKAAKIHLNRQKKFVENLNIDYCLASAEEFAEERLKSSKPLFDIIVCMEMLEHVPSPESVIAACAKLLKPGGQLFVSTLNRNVKSCLAAVIGAEWILKLLPKGTHDYAKFIRPSELSQWLRSENFSVKAITGMGYQPLTRQYYLTQDISVNYLVYAQKNAF